MAFAEAANRFNHFEHTNSKLHCRILCSVKALCTLLHSKGNNLGQTLFFFFLCSHLCHVSCTPHYSWCIMTAYCPLPTAYYTAALRLSRLKLKPRWEAGCSTFSNFKLQPGPLTTWATSFKLIHQASCFSFWSHRELCPFPLRHVKIVSLSDFFSSLVLREEVWLLF